MENSNRPMYMIKPHPNKYDQIHLDILGRKEQPNVYPLFWGPLAIALGLVYVGYRVGKPLDKAADAIREVADTVNEVKGKVEHLLTRVEELADTLNEKLEQLPLEFRGIVEENEMKRSMTNIKSASQVLYSYMGSRRSLRENLDSAERMCESLIFNINIVKEYTGGGATAVLQCAPAIALWTQVFTMIQRMKASPGKPPAMTVWDHYFHLENMFLLDQFFSEHAALRNLSTTLRQLFLRV